MVWIPLLHKTCPVRRVAHSAGHQVLEAGGASEGSAIRPGTVIATFDADGKYKGHAAIYESQTSVGLTVYDQWSGREFQPRVILFRGGGYVSNDGDAFYVVE